MYKISEIISLPVISIFESEYQGTIYNIIFDCKSQKCKFICILNENDNIEKVINVNDIYKVGKDCILIKNASSIELKSNYDYLSCSFSSIINLTAYNLNGEIFGVVSDIELTENFNIENIILSNGNTIEKKQILNLGQSTILTNNILVNISKFKPKLKKQTPKLSNNKVILLDKLTDNNKNTLDNRTINTNNENIKLITDYRFLIGRTISKDVLTPNGEMIAKMGTKVDSLTVKKASMYGKLIEISRNSKKN